jgi:hypothetical protein
MPIINLGEFDTPARSELNTHVEDDLVVQVCEDPPRLLISLTQGSVGRLSQSSTDHLEQGGYIWNFSGCYRYV